MRRSVLITILLIATFILSIFAGYFISSMRNNAEKEYLAEMKLAENTTNETVTTSSAENIISPKSGENNEEVVDNNIKYMLKEYNGCIAVYRIEEGNEPVLEDATDILTKYLPEEDLMQLQNGITVVGIDELTHLLEDFEQ